jgi:hypothetical protein
LFSVSDGASPARNCFTDGEYAFNGRTCIAAAIGASMAVAVLVAGLTRDTERGSSIAFHI